MDAITVERAPTTPSNLLRRKLCPGSARMEAGLPELRSAVDSGYSKGGSLIHKYWTNPNFERRLLTTDEQDLLLRADQLHADVLGVLNFELPDITRSETTITGVNKRLTGTPDLVNVWNRRRVALVTDLKSGFFVVEKAELNLQLRGYAVLTAENHAALETVYVSILQPRLWTPSERTTLAQYSRADIVTAETEIDRIIDGTEQPDAPVIAGEEQCRYCRAKLICPAFRAAVGKPLAKFKTEADLSKLKREDEIKKRVKGCTDKQLEELLRAVTMAGVVEEVVRGECRERIKAGKFTSHVLGKDWEARTVTNVRRAITLLALSNVASREEIIDRCTLPLKTLEELLRSRHKSMTWQQARDRIDRILKAVLVREPREPKILPATKKRR